MKAFKLIDCIISIFLIGYFVMISIDAYFNWKSRWQDFVIYGYLIVGAWQIVSMIVHATQQWFMEKKGIRSVYHWIAFLAVLAMVTLIWFYVLLFIAPFMAIFYTCICCHETFVKMKRPVTDLV